MTFFFLAGISFGAKRVWHGVPKISTKRLKIA
jgi:hypothetical protein